MPMGASAPDPEAGFGVSSVVPGVAMGLGVAVGAGAAVGVAVGAGGTGVAVGVGVGVGLEQAAMSAASANKIVQLNSFDMKAAKLLRLGVIPTGVQDSRGASLSPLESETDSDRRLLMHMLRHGCPLMSRAFLSIASGAWHTCGVRTDGAIVC